MPKTDAEWEALDDRIAREVMGWVDWDELPEEMRTVYWQMMGRESDVFWITPVSKHKAWWSVVQDDQFPEGIPKSEIWQCDWAPYLDVDQALAAAERLVCRGYDLTLRTWPWCYPSWMAAFDSHNRALPYYTSHAGKLAEAICLGLEKWMDRQQEKGDGQD